MSLPSRATRGHSPEALLIPPTQQFAAVTDLVQNILTQARQPDQRFYLVVLPEDDYARVEEFTDSIQLIRRIRELLGTDVSLFPFLGYRLGITKGPHRFLQTPFGALPLFLVPGQDELELESSGFVGKHQERANMPTPMPSEESDEEEPATVASPLPVAPTDEDDSPVLPS